MAPSSLLARITLALSAVAAVSVGVVGCGETTDSGVGSAAGNGSGGSSNVGGSSNQGGSSSVGGSNNVGGSNVGGSGLGGGCARALPAGGKSCRVTADCGETGLGLQCYPPGKSSCGGGDFGPPQASCQTDADCTPQGADRLCQPQSFGETVKRCGNKCTASDQCGPSLACDVGTGRCEAISCASSGCPVETFCDETKVCAYQSCNANRGCLEGFSCSTTTFTCEPTKCSGQAAGECPTQYACDEATKLCARLSCTCDAQCPSEGFCTSGSCYQTPGSCQGGCAAGRPLIGLTGEPLVAVLLRGAAWM